MILTWPCYVKPRQDFVTKNYRSGPPSQRPPPRRVSDVTRLQAGFKDKAGGPEYIRVRHQTQPPGGASPRQPRTKAHQQPPVPGQRP